MSQPKKMTPEQLYQERLRRATRSLHDLAIAASRADIEPDQLWEDMGAIVDGARELDQRITTRSYVHVSFEEGGSFISPPDALGDHILADISDATKEEPTVATFHWVRMTNEEFDDLPEFEGH